MVDCSRGTAGPRATGMLADYGADVVWVEPPGGDPQRRCAPEAVSVLARGKRSIEVGLHDAAAREQLLAVVDRAEVFVESWRPGGADRLGLGYDVLHARNPALVYVSISGFGEDSGIDLPGFEPMVQAVLGSMSDQVAHRDGPVYLGFPFASIGAASLAVLGGLAALRRAREDGCGRHVRTSLLDGALAYHSMLWGESDASIASHDAPLSFQSTSRTRLVTRSFECGDGEYLGLHTGAVGAFGRAMCVLGIDDRVPPSADGMDMGVPLTDEQIPILQFELVDIFKTRPRAEWVQRFLDADVCVVEHLRPTEVYDTPQARHNEMVVTVDDPVLGPVEQVAPAIKFSLTPGSVRAPAPTVGEHTDAVLATVAGWPAPDAPTARAGARSPTAAGRRAHPRSGRVLRGSVLVPAPRRSRCRRREGRAARRRPAPWHRATVLLGPGRQARHGRQPQGSRARGCHRSVAPARRRGAPQPATRCGRATGAR